MRHRLNRIVFALVAVLCAIGTSLPALAATDYLYVPCVNNLVIIDCTTDTIVKTIKYNDYIVGCTPSPDGKRFYMNSWKSIYVVDTESNKLLDKIPFFTDLNRVIINAGIAVSADNNYMYMSVSITKKKLNIPKLNVLPPQLIVYDLRKKEMVKNFEIPTNCGAVVTLRGDPDHVALMAQDIYKFNLKDGKMTKLLGLLHPEPGQPPLNSLVFWNNWSPGDHGIFVSQAYSPEHMYYILIDKMGKLTLLQAQDFVMMYSCILSPDTKYIYGVMDEVYKIDAKTGKTLAMDPVARGTCYACAMTSDGKKLYLGPAGPDISVYDTATMKCTGYISLPADGVVMNRISK